MVILGPKNGLRHPSIRNRPTLEYFDARYLFFLAGTLP